MTFIPLCNSATDAKVEELALGMRTTILGRRRVVVKLGPQRWCTARKRATGGNSNQLGGGDLCDYEVNTDL